MPRFAAIDIGSNSIRLKIAETFLPLRGLPELHPITYDRAITRLGETVFLAGRTIDRTAMKETFDVLRGMAAVCEASRISGVRAVATSAVRDAKNHLEFLDGAKKILGVNVDVISGPEEADLVHLGVHARWPQHPDRKSLIVDLGGGSAQFIYGHSGKVVERISRPIGAVRLKQMFLAHDPPRKSELRKMNRWIDEKLEDASGAFPQVRFDRLIITSGTASALVCSVHKLRRAEREHADRLSVSVRQVKSLYSKVAEMDLERRRDIRGIGARRAEVIVPGLAVVKKILAAFDLPVLTYSSASVADGVIARLAISNAGPAASHAEHFHVFLCHNTVDKPAVRQIAERLRDRGILPWLDEEQLQPGKPWQAALEGQIEKISSAAVFIGPTGFGPWHRAELDAFLRQFLHRNCPVIPVILPNTSEEPQLPLFLDGMTMVDFRMKKPDPLKKLIWGITGERPVEGPARGQAN